MKASGKILNGESVWRDDVLDCIKKLDKEIFTLRDIYAFADVLAHKHPDNKHVKDKIRQQLQFLRNDGVLEFLGKGSYKWQKMM